MEQIKKFHLPSNPAKLTDPRAKAYVAQFGDISWEVDALTPHAIKEIILDSLNQLIDEDKLQEVKERQQKDIDALSRIIANGVGDAVLHFVDEDELGEWVCPNCGDEHTDSEDIRNTVCGGCGVSVHLSDVVDDKRKAKLQ